MPSPNHANGLETITNQGLSWINLEKPTREKIDIIAKKFPIHELNIEDCLSKINHIINTTVKINIFRS